MSDDIIKQYGLETHLLTQGGESSMNYARFDLSFVESLQLGHTAALVQKIQDPPDPQVLLALKFIGKGALCIRALTAADRDACIAVLIQLPVMTNAVLEE